MDITVQEVKKAIDNNETFILLDVRTPMEYQRGKIAGAINIPVDDVPQMIEQAITDENTTIYVYCLSGSRSPIAVVRMEELGYKHVYNVEYGLMAWRYHQFPMV